MAASLACMTCKRKTKYECIRCERKVCTMCSTPEVDDSLPGWVVGKAVGYCSTCNYRGESDSENDDDRDTVLDNTNNSSEWDDLNERPPKR